MDKVTVIYQGTRLDTLVHEHYGDLSMYDLVLGANLLIDATALDVGDVVNMPQRKTTSEEDALW
ncbi:hypothetical protein [Abyssogena phaseoliformis symbiont]|uniref:hypothetical protein n=1 Tax=Abyssogena phaseoliformis symbiont TaxID=596095 RepID=UPI0019158B9B|nr:hypothetical protein [Abyssogena phaseoliformis symbiont]MBW5289446.1 hypothetical protein [Candidatus Ruthia sp. Apha_13_S6]